LLPNAQHRRVYEDVSAGGRPDPSRRRNESLLVTIAGLLLGAFIVVAAIGFIVFNRPARYEGPVRWSSDYATITLVDRGMTATVDDGTFVTVQGQTVGSPPEGPDITPQSSSRAEVRYWPASVSQRGIRSEAYARSVAIE
jgi:hypothetical protein